MPANDAMLVQLVRGSLGRRRFGGSSRINVSSCEFIVTLHGTLPNPEEVRATEDAVRRVPGVRGVENKLQAEGNSETRITARRPVSDDPLPGITTTEQ